MRVASCQMVDWVGAREVSPEEVGASEAGEIGEIFFIPTDVELLLKPLLLSMTFA